MGPITVVLPCPMIICSTRLFSSTISFAKSSINPTCRGLTKKHHFKMNKKTVSNVNTIQVSMEPEQEATHVLEDQEARVVHASIAYVLAVRPELGR